MKFLHVSSYNLRVLTNHSTEKSFVLELKKKLTVNPVLSGNSKRDKTKILMTIGSLMKVESIAECNSFDLHLVIICLENQF